MLKLIYYSPASYGGIADYAHEQANALVKVGVEVTLLTTPAYPTNRGENYRVLPILEEMKTERFMTNKLFKAIHYTRVTLSNIKKLACYIEENNIGTVLLGSYAEYLAPLWSYRLRRLSKQNVRFGAVVHDPIRDFVLGPLWWHRWSIACGYSFLHEAFVHESITLDTVKPTPNLRTTVIPFGAYCFPMPNCSRKDTRHSLRLPDDSKIMLAFGHIRDNKNLDLVIQAMAQVPEVYLVVAGKEQSSTQKLASFYQKLAERLGVSDRCRWLIRFIPNWEVANLFTAADLIVITYSKTFHSASSVLSTAVNYRKPCLASGGEGALRSVVQKYQLGIWVNPDCLESLVEGIRFFFEIPLNPQWYKYLEYNSWECNAKIVRQKLIEKQQT